MKIHIVFGATGLKEVTEWVACAYFDEEKAKHRICELENLMVELGVSEIQSYCGNSLKRIEFISKMQSDEKGDIEFNYLNGGVRYRIQTLTTSDDPRSLI